MNVNGRYIGVAALSLPLAAWANGLSQETITEVTHKAQTELSGDKETSKSDSRTEGLIADLAWILILGALVTVIFKKLKQPVVLGYILAGFLASPKFIYLPSISNLENIDFWAQLGIVVLMFTLGLEFSFKKLIHSGADAVIPALVIIVGMTFAGFGVGKLLDMDAINCIFLGGMVSMSSTTIILKALNDLGLRQRKFASLVLAVLILEDMFAVLMLVLLSSIAVGNVHGSALFYSVAKLAFFLVIWFVVGVYVLPTLLNRWHSYLNDETLLVVSMGLCFGMAVFSVACGFSLELGAFVTGSILAGTMFAERIERVVEPVKNLFGAVFFISVGMMVDPTVIVQYWSQILLLAVVVIVGMIIFGTLGMLLSGQSLRVAMESGFSLTQIGEFSFIIASLGMSLGVLKASLYPIIVAVSVITIFTTPYFIRMASPAYEFVERHLPEGLRFLIERYSKQPSDTSETRKLWRTLLTRRFTRIALYSIVLIAIIMASRLWLFPLLEGFNREWGKLVSLIITLLAMAPFLALLMLPPVSSGKILKHQSAGFYEVPLMALKVVSYAIAFIFIVYFISLSYSSMTGWLVGICCYALILLAASGKLRKKYRSIEKKFIDNLNVRENTRFGLNCNLVSDIHQAYITLTADSPFLGDKLSDSGLRRKYGVSISSIQRGNHLLALPSKDSRLFPGDVLGVIGTDDQIKRLNDDIEAHESGMKKADIGNQPEVELVRVKLTDSSPVVGLSVAQSRFRDNYYCMIVKIMDSEGEYADPDANRVLQSGDTLWVVGDSHQIEKMK